MINGTPVLGKHNPRWPIGNATETRRVPDVGPPGQHGPAVSASAAQALRGATAAVINWLAGLPRRAGSRLFAGNDEEARWRGWQVTQLSGGLARQYRDPRFDTLTSRIDQHGGLAESDPLSGAQPGPGLGGYMPGVPEAWDDHWDGRAAAEDDPPGFPRLGKGGEF